MDADATRLSWLEVDALAPGDVMMVSAAEIDALYRQESTRLTRQARRFGPGGAADIVQDAFHRFLRATHNGARPQRPAAYLSRIVGNLGREQARRDARATAQFHVPFDDAAIAGPDPNRLYEARDSLARIDRAIAAMRPLTRDVFLLHRLDGLDYEEIGERMGLSVKGVQKQMMRALRELRAAVGPRS